MLSSLFSKGSQSEAYIAFSVGNSQVTDFWCQFSQKAETVTSKIVKQISDSFVDYLVATILESELSQVRKKAHRLNWSRIRLQ